MKTKIFLAAPILLFLLYGGCSNGGGNNGICSLQEMQDRFADTDCIAEELVTGCTNVFCRFVDDAIDIRAGNLDENCSVVDCETLECGRIEIIVEDQTMVMPGFLSELFINETTGLPSGVFDVNNTQTSFDCSNIVSN